MRSFYDQAREDVARALEGVDPTPDATAKRLFESVYGARVAAFASVPRVAPTTRRWLDEEFDLSLPAVIERAPTRDDSEKLVLRFGDGKTAETIAMPFAGSRVPARKLASSLFARARRLSPLRVLRNLRLRDVASRLRDRLGAPKALVSVCLSTQVGCAIGCGFCFTGTKGLVRNLTAGEIVAQVLALGPEVGVGGIVFMGMGEPLHNLDATLRALSILRDEAGLGIRGDRIHVSTSGLVPAIDALAEASDVRLALSLHATTDAVRSRIVPPNDRYPIAALLDACRRYVARARGPIMIEYVLLSGVNDSPDDARRLVSLLEGLDAVVELIPFNPFEGAPFTRPDEGTMRTFRDLVRAGGLPTTMRFSKAGDVAGACGQLGLSVEGSRRGAGKRALPRVD